MQRYYFNRQTRQAALMKTIDGSRNDERNRKLFPWELLWLLVTFCSTQTLPNPCTDSFKVMTPPNTHSRCDICQSTWCGKLITKFGHASAILTVSSPLTLASSVSVGAGRFIEHAASEVGRRSRGWRCRRGGGIGWGGRGLNTKKGMS